MSVEVAQFLLVFAGAVFCLAFLLLGWALGQLDAVRRDRDEAIKALDRLAKFHRRWSLPAKPTADEPQPGSWEVTE